MTGRASLLLVPTLATSLLVVAGCSGAATVANAPSTNRAPTITGQPATSVVAGQHYSFTPSATDADGDALRFSVGNLPDWASFDSTTGKLEGIPPRGTAGEFSGITITVNDGTASASLARFAIVVSAPGSGSATVSWSPPTDREDGSALTNLSGYRIYFGTSADTPTDSVTIRNAGITTYTIDSLPPATYFFSVTAFDSRGFESDFSDQVSKTIN